MASAAKAGDPRITNDPGSKPERDAADDAVAVDVGLVRQALVLELEARVEDEAILTEEREEPRDVERHAATGLAPELHGDVVVLEAEGPGRAAEDVPLQSAGGKRGVGEQRQA